jgi:hypothetical protein
VALVGCAPLLAETVAVRHAEGLVRGFLALRTLDGATLADGDLTQVARGARVTTRLTFRFKDGSLHEETALFSESGRFRLIRDHLVQRGPTFPQPLDATVDAANGRVMVRSRDSKRAEVVIDQQLQLPEDVANGLMLTLIKNVDSRAAATTVSLVATTPKPRIVKVVISPAGEDPLSIGSTSHKAIRFRVRIEIGGITGVLAKLLGKQPPDTQVWVLPGEAPAFVKSEGPLYFGGPIWRIELTTPVWPRPPASKPR